MMLTQTNPNEVTVSLPRLHPDQKRALAAWKDHRFLIMPAGRAWGKTIFCENVLAEDALDGLDCHYGTSEHEKNLELYRRLERRLAPIITDHHKGQYLYLETGGSITFWTLNNPNAGQGRHPRGTWIIDEAGLVPDLRHSWLTSIRPSLTRHKARAIITGRPSVPKDATKESNDYWKLWTMAETDETFARFTASSHGNPYIDPAELELAKRQMNDIEYRQEILAEFVEGAASYFGDIQHAYTAPLDAPYVASHYYVAGIDWGQQNDYTVMVVIDATARQMVGMLRIRHELWSSMRAECVAMLKRYHVALAMPEANAMGSSQIEELRNEIYAAGLRTAVNAFTMSATSKPPLMQTLRMALTEGSLTLQPIDVLKHEMNAAQAVQKNGIWTVDSPRDEHGHGDTVVALGLAWRAAGFVVR